MIKEVGGNPTWQILSYIQEGDLAVLGMSSESALGGGGGGVLGAFLLFFSFLFNTGIYFY